MGRKKLSMSEKVRRYMAANPNAKPAAVAAAVGVKPALVYAIKYKKPNKVSPTLKEVNIDAAHKNRTFSVTVDMEKVKQAAVDVVNHPPHYKAGGIETIDFLQAKLTRDEFIGYLKGNVLKYGSRLGKKGADDIDAGKMAWYALKLRDMLSVAQ